MCRSWMDFFRLSQKNALGCYLSAGKLCIIGIEKTSEGWRVAAAEDVPMGDADGISIAAEKVAAFCGKTGWPPANIGWMAAEEEAYLIQKEFPAMSEEELQEAVRWEMIGQSPFGEETVQAYCQAIGQDNSYWLGYMRARAADEIGKACRENALPLERIAVPQEDWLPAREEIGVDWMGTFLPVADSAEIREWEEDELYALEAALLAVHAGAGLNFLKKELPDAWNWRRLAAAAAIFTGIALSGFGIAAGWEVHAAEAERMEAEQQRKNLAQAASQKKEIEDLQRDVALREDKLTALTKERTSWYSVLVHFGANTVDGVWLEDVSLQDCAARNILHLKGRAINYAALTAFLARLEHDDFFAGTPVLESSSMAADDHELEFSLAVSLQGVAE